MEAREEKIWEWNCGHTYMDVGDFTQLSRDILEEEMTAKEHQNGICQRKDDLQHQISSTKGLFSVYFLHSGFTDVCIEKNYKCIGNHCKRKHFAIIVDDFNAQLVPDDDCWNWLRNKTNVTSGWHNGWWFKTMRRQMQHSQKCPQNEAACRFTRGKDKQLDYVLFDKRSIRYYTRRPDQGHDSLRDWSQTACCTFSIVARKKKERRTEQQISE